MKLRNLREETDVIAIIAQPCAVNLKAEVILTHKASAQTCHNGELHPRVRDENRKVALGGFIRIIGGLIILMNALIILMKASIILMKALIILMKASIIIMKASIILIGPVIRFIEGPKRMFKAFIRLFNRPKRWWKAAERWFAALIRWRHLLIRRGKGLDREKTDVVWGEGLKRIFALNHDAAVAACFKKLLAADAVSRAAPAINDATAMRLFFQGGEGCSIPMIYFARFCHAEVVLLAPPVENDFIRLYKIGMNIINLEYKKVRVKTS